MEVLFRVENCSVTIADKTILTPLSIDINRGDFLTITGESGTGKSTLLQLILGFREPTNGTITYLGKKLIGKQLDRLRSDTAVVFQEPPLSGESIEEILLLPFSYKKNRGHTPSKETLEQTLISVSLPTSILKQRPEVLSGGEKQRIALARALLLNRPILVLDEISSALDAQNRDRIFQLLQKNSQTVIVVSHDKEWIEKSTKLLTLKGANDGNR